MLRPPSLNQVLYYPVTSSVAVAAIAVSLLKWSGQNIDEFVMNNQVWDRWQLWRAITSTLPHVDFLHLAFNIYWLWTFGALVERVFGHVRCAGIFLLLAVGSMLAEFSILLGGVGLSGVGYGLWGMLWVLEKSDGRFAGAVDKQTSQTFVVWFFLCIVLTCTNIMPVANIAHGVGAVMGILLGLTISGGPREKVKGLAGLSVILSLALLGSTVFWPWVNCSPYAELEVEQAALAALDEHRNAHAIKLLEQAITMRQPPARAWYNLGVAYQRVGRTQNAVRAFEHAGGMPDANSEMRNLAGGLKEFQTPVERATNR